MLFVQAHQIVCLALSGYYQYQVIVGVWREGASFAMGNKLSSCFQGIDHGPGLCRPDDAVELGISAHPAQFGKLVCGGEQGKAPFPPGPVDTGHAGGRGNEGGSVDVGVENYPHHFLRAVRTASTAIFIASFSLIWLALGPGLRTSASQADSWTASSSIFSSSLAQLRPLARLKAESFLLRSLGSNTTMRSV